MVTSEKKKKKNFNAGSIFKRSPKGEYKNRQETTETQIG